MEPPLNPATTTPGQPPPEGLARGAAQLPAGPGPARPGRGEAPSPRTSAVNRTLAGVARHSGFINMADLA